MKSITIYPVESLLICILLLVGCQKPGPIELQDSGGSQISEVEPVPASSGFGDEPDTTGLVAADRERYFAELIVAGIRYDAPDDSHTISLARGVFRDKAHPIVIAGRRIGYRTLDIGNLFIDGLPLNKLQRRIRLNIPGFPIDTLVGPYYLLLNKDGVGGRGFRYLASHRYEWEISGPADTVKVYTVSASEIRVTQPAPQDTLSQRRDVLVEWTGGEEVVQLIISMQLTGEPARPIVRMRLRSERRRVVIPSKVLQMLPVDRSARFVFSFVSQRSGEVQVSGYSDTVLVHSASIHNLLLTIQR